METEIDSHLDDHMGEVKVSVSEEGAPEVQKDGLRLLLMQPEGFERHRVVQWPNCNSLFSMEEATFIWIIKFCFLIVLTMGVINCCRHGRWIRDEGEEESGISRQSQLSPSRFN